MNKYSRPIGRDKDGLSDVYDVLEAFMVMCPARQHAIKKILMPGARGSKTVLDDLREAKQSIERAIELQTKRGTLSVSVSAADILTGGNISASKIDG